MFASVFRVGAVAVEDVRTEPGNPTTRQYPRREKVFFHSQQYTYHERKAENQEESSTVLPIEDSRFSLLYANDINYEEEEVRLRQL